MTNPRAVVKALDHLVLTCTDVAATANWYSKYLGMKVETFRPQSDPTVSRTALKFGIQKINLHQKGKEFEPKAKAALPGTADLCFVVDNGVKLDELLNSFRNEGNEILEGGSIVARTGAQGPIRSLYIRDPDGNLIE